ncbi:hypothetical protein BJF80_06760 [Serinicoccus sp. CUA-874]|nr:hypothetical protein BJF80_06760 [Serinicoccus sp. CUA-874]
MCLQTRSHFFGKQTQLVMVLAQGGGLLEHGHCQTASLSSCYWQRVACLQRAAGTHAAMVRICWSLRGFRASMPKSMLRRSAVRALRLAVRCWSMIERDASSTRNAARFPACRGRASWL